MVVVLAWSFGYLGKINDGGELSWARSIYKLKAQKANKAKGSRRVLILGGSGTHFGVNAQQIEQELGIPVFNMGVHGSLGINIILDSISGQIHRGDFIVVIPEYAILEDEDGIDRMASPFGIAIGRPGLGGVPYEELAEDLLNAGNPGLKYVTKSSLDFIRQIKNPRYYSDRLNANGDPVDLKRRIVEPAVLNIHLSAYACLRLKKFRDQLDRSEATLILALPWVYTNIDENTLVNAKKITEKLLEISPVIYDKKSFNLKNDSTLFGDTVYHLNDKGIKIRSLELAQQLKQVLKAELGVPNSKSGRSGRNFQKQFLPQQSTSADIHVDLVQSRRAIADCECL
ncbi:MULTISPECIES: hypothetical protein [unclassified Coleofasciculus]|uniref:hypothetical protein n=1 Tax=unclassified Coleofasciculus TaxID=2692782 RepID=UPI00187EEA6F|nr:MULTISPECIES: hypothetical protein [unclassified Coleofasciculus]MBE9125803.1 hypothetical protein [Coleofasciculus sp. LEGE 07081]MBE9149012.1 hypothetical protein [Coleofasciculus sp. LEGE 07092]